MGKHSFLEASLKVEVFCAPDSILWFSFFENIFPGHSSREWVSTGKEIIVPLGTACKGEMPQFLLL